MLSDSHWELQEPEECFEFKDRNLGHGVHGTAVEYFLWRRGVGLALETCLEVEAMTGETGAEELEVDVLDLDDNVAIRVKELRGT